MLFFFALSIIILTLEGSEQYTTSTRDRRSALSCPNDYNCAFIDHCPSILSLISRNEYPVRTFRQSICGYDDGRPKVCCQGAGYWIPTPNTGSSWTGRSNIECGKSLFRSSTQTIGTYPFLVRIGFIDTITFDIKYPCSGVIINERNVLTTASCALATTGRYKLYSVLIGEYNTETNPDCNALFCGHETKSVNVSYVIKHPAYHAKSFSNNIALLRLTDSIDFMVTAQPVCFLPDSRYVPTGSVTVLVGWGKTSEQRVKSPLQQSIEMTILSQEKCTSYLNEGISIELCAAGQEEPCSGYSGSPLLFKYGDTYFLIGILSCGSDCETHLRLPSVFINVQKYLRWLQENA